MSRRVLVVDDNRDLADNIAEILEVEGYATQVCYAPDQALDRAGLEPYDVAILDVRLPGMDGVTLFKKLSDMHPEATYVLITAFTTDERIADAMAAGVRAVLPKPVPIDDLFELLPAPEGGARPVLVVEDDRALGSSLAEALADRGYRPRVCHDLVAAREEVKAHGPPLAAVVDVRLPDGDGSDLASELCAAEVPVILVTGYEPSEAVESVQQACANNCRLLTKPFSPIELLDSLQRLASDQRSA